MQCANCRFENMPGLDLCGRCGASLRLGGMAIDVHPPRASARVKRIRKFLPPGRLGITRRLGLLARGLTGMRVPDVPAAPVLWRMLFPGWAQRHLGHNQRGKLFQAAFLGCLVPALLTIGSPLGSILLGLAVAVHLSSVVDVVLVGEQKSRGARAVLCCLLVLGCVYVPITWLASQVATPRRILADAAPFARGDVVLVHPQAYRWQEPSPGEVVLFQAVGFVVPGRYLGRVANIRIEGERIERILAGPGQTLEITDGRLMVDSQPVAYSALNPERMPATLKIKTPPQHYVIIPTTALAGEVAMQSVGWEAVSVVPREQILGKAWLRHYPFWRFWWIR